ncbi:type II toxin-antitoxin system Phd/YefM family antitoxin [Actinomycetes bacterium KLBMP 9759]
MVEVGVHVAKSTLSELLRRVAGGEEVTITRGGEPVARLVPIQRRGPRKFGADEGVFEVPEDFNEPLPDELQRAFEG